MAPGPSPTAPADLITHQTADLLQQEWDLTLTETLEWRLSLSFHG